MWSENDNDRRYVADLGDDVRLWPQFLQRDYYTRGKCHELAAALAKLTGYPLGVLWDARHWHIEPDADGNGGVRQPIHVCVTDPEGFVIDIDGRRTLDDMRRAMAPLAVPSRWEDFVYETISMERLRELAGEVGCLHEFVDGEYDQAVEVIRSQPELYAIVSRIDPSFAPPPEPPAPPAPLPGF